MRALLVALLVLVSLPSQAATIQFLNQAGRTGVLATYPNGFNSPQGLALSADGNKLFVADTGNGVVQVLNAHTLRPLEVLGRSVLQRPQDLAVDAQGHLYVTDEQTNRIAVFDISHPFARLLGSLERGFAAPSGIAFDRYQRIYVSNRRNHTIMMLSHHNPVVLKRAGGQGQDAGLFLGPGHIAAAPNGMILVADPGNNRIQILSPNLDVVSIVQGGENYSLNHPQGFCISPGGEVIVSDTGHQRLLLLNSRFQLVAVIGHPGRGIDGFQKPVGVVYRGNEIWVADSGNQRILHYRLP